MKSIFENHLTVSAILGEVMWVTAASVKWAESESLQQISDQKSSVYDLQISRLICEFHIYTVTHSYN